MPSPPEARFIRSPRARIKHVGTGIAVYVPERKAIHVLNSTAHLLFELLAEPATESELRLALAMATGSNPPSIAGDVSEALAGFIDLGIVEPEAQ